MSDTTPAPPTSGNEPAGNDPKRNDAAIALRVWGARGSLPTPGSSTVRYGGNTLCVEVRCGPHLLILDAGSGLREFGLALAASGVPADADILLSHTHLDHICGLPFFAPMFDPNARLRFWGGHLAPPDGIEQALSRSWRAPLMPDLDKAFRARLRFHDFTPGVALSLHPGLTVATTVLNHPGRSIGYRIEWAGTSLCFLTDTEQPAHGVDQAIARFVNGTDIMIYDASFTDEEYRTRVGWGHSTWRMAADLADAGQVGRLVLFHHDPGHDDTMMDQIAEAIEARRPGSLVAMEGMRLHAA